MGLDDKIENETQDASGKVKEHLGSATGDDSMEAEGKKDQAAAGLKKAGESLKDGVDNLLHRDKD